MNYFKQFINDILTEVSYRTNEGVVNLKNKDHISILSEVLDEMELTEIKNELIRNLLEAGEQTLDPDQKEKAKKMGLVWKGKGWGKEEDDFVSYNVEKGKLVKVDRGGESGGEEEAPKTSLSPGTKSGDSYIDSLPDGDPAKKAVATDTKKFSSEDNKKSLDSFIKNGFSKSKGAPGSAGSMLNEIFSSTGATNALNSNSDFNFDETLDSIINELKGTGLAKENKSNNLPTGIKKSEAQPIAEKYGISLGEAGKSIIAARAAKSKHNHVSKNIIEKNNISNSKSEPFFGDKDGMMAQQTMVSSTTGKVFLGNTEVTKEEAIKIIKSGGGGENPSDTAIFILNEDTGDLHMTFYSDKDNVSAIVAQSSLKAEFKLKKNEVDNLVENGKLSNEESEIAKKIMDESESKHSDLESQLDNVTAGPGKHLNTIESDRLVKLSKSLSKGADPEKYWNNNIKKKMLKSTSSQYLPDGSDTPPNDVQIMRAFINYANDNPGNLTKDEQRIISDLSNQTDGPRIGAEIGKIRKATVATDLDTINKLNDTKIMVNGKEVGLGNLLEAESVAEKLHLGMMFGGEGVFQDSDAFYQESGGVKVDKESLENCLPFENKDDMIVNFEVGEEKEQIQRGGTNITGGSKIIYAVTKDGKKYAMGEKKQRSKMGVLGKLATVYNYHPDLQKCLKSKS
jgi:hypothetical protein